MPDMKPLNINTASTQGLVEQADRENLAAEVEWYARHLRAIFHGPCTCRPAGCTECTEWDFCPPHDDTCPACIAENALYIARTHPHAAVLYDEARQIDRPERQETR